MKGCMNEKDMGMTSLQATNREVDTRRNGMEDRYEHDSHITIATIEKGLKASDHDTAIAEKGRTDNDSSDQIRHGLHHREGTEGRVSLFAKKFAKPFLQEICHSNL